MWLVTEQKRVMLVFGTRPEAIKMAPLVLALQEATWCDPIVVVTAQHREMLDQVMGFFSITADEDLDLLMPGQTLAQLTARALAALDPMIQQHQPHAIVVQGDTTSTFVGALAAFYHQVPVVHLEAGLRTDDPHSPYPEEINRRLTTQLSTLHLAATPQAGRNLLRDGVNAKDMTVTGNTVIDALRVAVARKEPWGDTDLERIDASGRRMVLVTAHRRESWGEPMAAIGRALAELSIARPDVEFVFPIHRNPLVRDAIIPTVSGRPNVTIIEPQAYGVFSRLIDRAYVVLTDSGGVQEEAPSLGKPVLVMRDTTERPEAVTAGTAKLVGTDQAVIKAEVLRLLDDPAAYASMAQAVNPYGDGLAVERSVAAIAELLGCGSRLPDFTG
jgi:UDP-N-acetylglucosamine 2-epimerase (non-hydrolysing)